MDNDHGTDYSSILARLSIIAMYIVLGIGLAAIIAGYLIIQSGSGQQTENILFRNILFVLCLVELAAIQFLKRQLLSKYGSVESSKNISYQTLLPPTLVIAAMCSAISVYGLVAVILGSSLEVLLLFVAVSLIGYQLFRIRERDLKS
ncbi:MAG: hypothetical protein V3W18_13185 [candidate division Zixibacteria bacterium]